MRAAVEDWMPRAARQASTAAATLPSTASAPTPWAVSGSGGSRQTRKAITAAVASSTTANAALAYFSLRLAAVTGGLIAQSAPDIIRGLKPRPDFLDVADHQA